MKTEERAWDRKSGDAHHQLEPYFPFDPYHLPISKRWVEGDYNEWKLPQGMRTPQIIQSRRNERGMRCSELQDIERFVFPGLCWKPWTSAIVINNVLGWRLTLSLLSAQTNECLDVSLWVIVQSISPINNVPRFLLHTVSRLSSGGTMKVSQTGWGYGGIIIIRAT